jgi:hypothetical protein
MAACDVLFFDPAQVGRLRTDPFGEQAGPPSDGWRPCPANGHGWLDPAGQWRHVCPCHQRQITALHTTGQASHVRWAG